MKKKFFAGIMSIAIFTFFSPMQTSAQLISKSQYDGDLGRWLIDLHNVPLHASDFFKYGRLEMFEPYNQEFMEGWRWNIGRFNGSRKPVEMKVTTQTDGYKGSYFGDNDYKVTYNSKGDILTYNDGLKFSSNDAGSFPEAGATWYPPLCYRMDAFIGDVTSTLNGYPYDMKRSTASVTYQYNNDKVIEATFTFRNEDYFGYLSAEDLPNVNIIGAYAKIHKAIFTYKYDKSNNIVKIAANVPKCPDESQTVTMEYDSQNRLIQQTIRKKLNTKIYYYKYDNGGAVIYEKILNYDEFGKQSGSGITKNYDVKRDTNGRIVSVHDDILDTYVTYDYDSFGNWTDLKVFARPNSPKPYTAVHRELKYAGVNYKPSPAVTSPKPSQNTQIDAILSQMKVPDGNIFGIKPRNEQLKTPEEVGNIYGQLRKFFSGSFPYIFNSSENAKLENLLSQRPEDGYNVGMHALLLALQGHQTEAVKKAGEAVKRLYSDGGNYYWGMDVTSLCIVMPVLINFRYQYAKQSPPPFDAKKWAEDALPKLEAVRKSDPYAYSLAWTQLKFFYKLYSEQGSKEAAKHLKNLTEEYDCITSAR